MSVRVPINFDDGLIALSAITEYCQRVSSEYVDWYYSRFLQVSRELGRTCDLQCTVGRSKRREEGYSDEPELGAIVLKHAERARNLTFVVSQHRSWFTFGARNGHSVSRIIGTGSE